MKMSSRCLFALAFSFTLVAGCRTAQQQGAGRADSTNPCQQLVVVPTTTGLNFVTMNQGGVVCTHGSLVGIDGGYSPEQLLSVGVQQDVVYGPNCNFTFQVGSSTYVINAQQDFCNLEAGKVTASVVSGDATITSTSEGSYNPGTSGVVNVTLNVPASAVH